MSEVKIKLKRRARRQTRIRKKIAEVSSRPRLSIFKSNKFLYAQIIDDTKGHTLVAVNEKEVEDGVQGLGKLLATKAKEKKVSDVVFDRGRYKYHGKVKAFVDAAREGGLNV